MKPGLYLRDVAVLDELSQVLGEIRRKKPRSRISGNALACELLSRALHHPGLRKRAIAAVS